MRAMAGYTTANGMYFNPRSAVAAKMELLEQTPFKFAFESHDDLINHVSNNNGQGSTALQYCKLMKNLAVIFLQDAAAMWLKHEDRRDHPLYKLPVFGSIEWQVSFCLFVVVCCIEIV